MATEEQKAEKARKAEEAKSAQNANNRVQATSVNNPIIPSTDVVEQIDTIDGVNVVRKREIVFSAEEKKVMAVLEKAGFSDTRIKKMGSKFNPQVNDMPNTGFFAPSFYISAEADNPQVHHLRFKLLDKIGGNVVGDVSLSNLQLSGAIGEQSELPVTTTANGTFIKIQPVNPDLARMSQVELCAYLPNKQFRAEATERWVRDYNFDEKRGAVLGHASSSEARDKASAKGCYKVTITG